MEIRDTEKKAMLAKRESEIYEYKLMTQQSTGYGWLDVLGAFANTAGSISYHNNYVNLIFPNLLYIYFYLNHVQK